MRQITGAPIKFAGTSEKIDGLEVFDAERHAGRVLGMGDIVALVEEVTKGVDMAAAEKLAGKLKSGSGFDLNDFLSQISQMKKMGGLSGLMDKLPSADDGQGRRGRYGQGRARHEAHGRHPQCHDRQGAAPSPPCCWTARARPAASAASRWAPVCRFRTSTAC